MANNRPIRAPRQGWRRGRRRPTRWIDCFSTGQTSVGLNRGYPWNLLVAPALGGGESVSTLREIISGDLDTTILDRQEVRIDRVVGDLHFFQKEQGVPALGLVSPTVVRVGLIVEEDSTRPAATPITSDEYSLWENDDLQRLEWMYLEQVVPTFHEVTLHEGDNEAVYETYWSTHLDVRVRRKLGKSDKLWLVMSYANGLASSSTSNVPAAVYYSDMLRAVIVT